MKLAHLSILMLMAVGVRADVIYNVTWNTSDPTFSGGFLWAGPFSLAFELADGSGVGDGNNSVTLSNFQFAGGAPWGAPFLGGSVSGDLSSGISFTDASPTSVFFQGFTPGNALSFTIDATTNLDPGGIPDEFIMSLLDSSLSPIPTTSSSPLFPVLVFDIDSANPTVQRFAADLYQPPVAGNFVNFPAPVVTAQAPPTSPVPEPASVALLVTVIAGLAVWSRKRVIP